MGSPDFAVPALKALLDAGHQVVCVYSQPPRPAGRGQKDRPSPVQAFAESIGLKVRTPVTLKNPEVQKAFKDLGADCAVVAAYGLILPPAILAAPRLGCLNIHASLLPRWRGAAPIQRAIEAGDGETGISIMQMDRGLDTGPVLMHEAIPLAVDATAATLHDTLADMGARLIVRALANLKDLTPVSQPDDGVTYAAKLEKDEGRLDWRRPAGELERKIRALTPWPGAWFEHRGNRIKVMSACCVDGNGTPGTVLDDKFTVACGDRALRLDRVQRPGKAAAAGEAFLRGYDLAEGTVLP
ncbi:MAG: methionyl-tRNA formyltransferase [Rhodospirillales bacterium]|nr:methionyl-tRNA formyltransferase [Rhodospirillales bacterium]